MRHGWHPLTVDEHSLAWFNAAPAEDLRVPLRACNAADRFTSTLLAGRPYASADDLADAAETITLGLPWEQVSTAIAVHPRIGDRVAGDSAEARASRTEQATMATVDDDLQAALVEANRSYEKRFGHVFLIRAAGRSPAEMLSELRRRLANDESSERGEVVGQLAEITRRRVQGLVRS